MSAIGLDKVLVTAVNKLTSNATIWTQFNDCHQCPLEPRGVVPSNGSLTFVLDTRWTSNLELKADGAVLCKEPSLNLDEGGSYLYNVDGRGCEFWTLSPGRKFAAPLYIAIGIYVLLALVSYLVRYMWRRHRKYSHDKKLAAAEGSNLEEDNVQTPGQVLQFESVATEDISVDVQRPRKREKSLDTLRGLVITSMIFVNYGAGGYAFIDHAPWFGITFADVIFPSFIFMMGISIALSLRAQLSHEQNYGEQFKRIVIRSLKLFALGLILNTDNTNLINLRIPGVLQRFAMSYFVVATLHLISVRRAAKVLNRGDFPTVKQSVLIFSIEIASYSLIFLIYVFFTFFFEFEQCPAGYQGPGGLDSGAHYFNCTGGAAGYLDRTFFGQDHIYQFPTSKEMYKHVLPHDPEGLLGVTMSILLTALGLISGRVLIKHKNPYRRAVRWFILSVSCGVVSFVLAASGLCPVSKNLWSLSFVAATGSIALSLLLICYLLVDVTEVWPEGRPMSFAGRNAILLYIGHDLGGRYFPFNYHVDETSHALMLMRNCIATTLWVIIAYVLDKKKIYFVI